MSPETSGPLELHDAASPGAGGWPDSHADGPDRSWPDSHADGPDRSWPDDQADEPDPYWPDDDAEDEQDPDWPDDWPDNGGDDPPWRRAAPPAAHGRDGGRGGPGRPGLRPLTLAIVAVVALAGGAGVALAITKGLDHSSSPSAAPSTQPSAVAPGGSGGGPAGGGTVPGGGSVGRMFVAGPVTAVSSTSITIGGGPGQSLTAAITSSTKITGKATSIGGIKVGDQVSAQITESNGSRPAVTAIQDPAQAPSGGGLP
jgi:hypothetical protein